MPAPGSVLSATRPDSVDAHSLDEIRFAETTPDVPATNAAAERSGICSLERTDSEAMPVDDVVSNAYVLHRCPSDVPHLRPWCRNPSPNRRNVYLCD